MDKQGAETKKADSIWWEVKWELMGQIKRGLVVANEDCFAMSLGIKFSARHKILPIPIVVQEERLLFGSSSVAYMVTVTVTDTLRQKSGSVSDLCWSSYFK